MNKRVLFVDDEPNVLSAVKRILRKHFDVTVAEYPEEALADIARLQHQPFAVIVSDMRMPKMDGAEFLQLAGQIAPRSVRIMLTGNTDQATAVRAVNNGEVFRFVNKPCEAAELLATVEDAVRQHALLTAEQDLLEKTLVSSVRLLVDTLALAQPEMFGRVSRLRALAGEVVTHLDGSVEPWEVDAAASLSQLGCLHLPAELVAKRSAGGSLTESERQLWATHPEMGADMVGSIERLDGVAAIIRYQYKWINGRGVPADDVRGEQIPLGARILHAVLVFDALRMRGSDPVAILARMRERRGQFDGEVLDALDKALQTEESVACLEVAIGDLEAGMCIDEDIVAGDGQVLAVKGQDVTATLIRLLHDSCEPSELERAVLVSLHDDHERVAAA